MTYLTTSITQDGEITYTPFIKDGRVGYRIYHVDGRTEFLYFNPSSTDEPNDWNVFVYQGETGDPANDHPAHFYNVLEDEHREHAIIEAARRVLDIYRRPKMYDAEDFDDAIAALDAALPPEPHAPIRPKREDEPF